MTIQANGQLIDFKIPKIMGILNLTEDSFYDGGKYLTEDTIVPRVAAMVADGMDILDVGAMSSRPGSEEIPIVSEIEKLHTIIPVIAQYFPDLPISVDTYRPQVIESCVSLPVHIINDITGGANDEKVYQICVQEHWAYVMMHMQGKPKTMQQKPVYNDVVFDLLVFFKNQLRKARSLGLKDIMIDVGFGFGKTLAHNYTLLDSMRSFEILDAPIVAGVSRKSMIYKALNIKPDQALNGTTALHIVALERGAKILRVHDIKEAKQSIDLHQLLIQNRL